MFSKCHIAIQNSHGPLYVEKAALADVPRIQALVNSFAERGEMLLRPLSEIYENLRDFVVVRHDGRVVGCAALHISWADLAEVKSLAVAEGFQRQGVGLALARACLDEARALGIPRVFALTYKPDFFEKLGFRRVEMDSLPRKVWGECVRCPRFPDCDENALIIELAPPE